MTGNKEIAHRTLGRLKAKERLRHRNFYKGHKELRANLLLISLHTEDAYVLTLSDGRVFTEGTLVR